MLRVSRYFPWTILVELAVTSEKFTPELLSNVDSPFKNRSLQSFVAQRFLPYRFESNRVIAKHPVHTPVNFAKQPIFRCSEATTHLLAKMLVPANHRAIQ
jgi:hypothetical protein